MANNKKSTYMTVDQIRKQERENRFKKLKFDDDKTYSVDEIRQAAIDQGLIKRPEPTIETPSVNENERQSAESKNPLDLRNAVKKTETETIPKIQKEAIRNYNLSKVGRDYLSNYNDTTSYTDVKNDIEELKNRKGGAARRNKDTAVYDRAIAMLEEYAANNYSLNDNKTSYADKEAIYKDNKQLEEGLGKNSNSATDSMYRDYALMSWLGSYDHKGIKDSTTNQEAIKSFNKATGGNGYDLSGELGGLSDNEIASKADEIRTYFQDKYGYKSNTDYLNAAQNFYSDLQNRYNKAKTDNKTYERIGEVAARTADIVKKGDYADKSLVGDYGTPTTKEDINDYLKNNQAIDYSDIQGFDSKNVDSLPDKLGSFLSAEGIKNQNTSSEFPPERKIAINLQKTDNAFTHPVSSPQSGYDDLMTEGYNNGWDVISDEEKGVYYYIYNTEGKESAYEYLNSLKNTLQKRKNYDNVKEATRNSADSGTIGNLDFILRSAASVPDNAFGGATGTLDNVAHYISGEDVEPYSPAHAAALSAAATREATGEALDEQFWHTDSPWGVNPSDIYGGVMSSADMLTSYFTGEAPYLALMGLNAAESTARDLYEQGEDNATIAKVSTASGIAEALFEKLSIEQIWNIANLDGAKTAKEIVKKYAYNMARAAGVEASEEVATEAANMVVDYIVRGSRSDTADASIEDIGSRIYKAGVGGAIGGLIGGGGATTLSAVAKSAEITQDKIERNKYIASVGADVTNAGNTQALLDTADQMKDNAEVQAQAQKVRQAQTKNAEKGTESTAKTLSRETGKLYAAIQDSNAQGIQNAEASEIKAAIKQAYAAETGEDVKSDTVTQAAEAIYKSEYTGEKLTRAERNLASTSQAQSAVESVRNNPDLIEQGTQKAQERAFNKYISTAQLTLKQETKTDEDVDIAEFHFHKDDGKVYTADGKKQVDIASVASIGKNDITFALKDGQTESAKALDMPTKQAVLAQSVLDVQKSMGIDLTPEIANTLYKGYEQSDIKSVSAYMQDAQKVLFNGYTNNTKIDNTINLPQGLRNQLYSMGRQLAASHTQAQQQAVIGRVKGNKPRKGSVTFVGGIKRGQLDSRRRAGVDTVENLAKSLGFDVVFYRSTKNGEGRYSSEYVRKNKFTAEGQQAPSGFWRGGKMYLDINAGMNGEGLILFTASHELVHMIREGSPEAFQELADSLVKNYAEQGVNINDLVLKEMSKSTNLTRDEAFEEVIAESCETFLRDTHLNDKAQELYKQNPTLWSRIREALKRIINSIKEAYAVARPQSEEARITNRADIETLEKAYDLWTKGIIKSAENLRNMENELADTKYQSRSSTDNIAYKYAVKNKDTEKAQRLVDRTANRVFADSKVRGKDGKLRKVYHYTNTDFYTFDTGRSGRNQGQTHGDGIYISTSPEEFSYAGKKRMTLYADITNPFEMELTEDQARDVLEKYAVTKHNLNQYDGLYRNHAMNALQSPIKVFDYLKEYADDNGIKVSEILQDLGFDGVHDGSEWVAFSSKQLKSANPVTYDNNGDVISLSKRFNESNKDIRYQSRDNEYLNAVEEGDIETAQKMVDEAAEKAGYNIKAYHGTARADRVGNVFRPERATSGPMAFFTDSKEIAGNYARDKADTSIAYDSDYDSYYTQFRVQRGNKTISISELWNTLPYPEKQKIKERAKHIKFDDDAENIIYDEKAQYGNGNVDDYTFNMHRGNALDVLVDSWLESGDLWGEEEKFLDVLKLSGVDGVEYFDPDFRDEKVYETYLNISNPYDTSTVDNDFIDRLEDWWSEQDEDEYYKESSGADMWDKNSMTVEDFVGRLRDDLESKTSHAWTSIPDAITAFLKYEGYDGIKDTGGKNGGESHTVWIPFSSEQIKSADPVTYDDNGDVIPLSQRFDSTKTDIRYQSRDDDLFSIDLSDDDTITNVAAREFVTHHEDMGEVLKNIADIDIEPKRVDSIINRVSREYLGSLDAEAKHTLSIEIQLALERVNNTDAQTVSDTIIDAVRRAIEKGTVSDERAEANYKDLLDAFKGKKFYLSDEQINQLKEHDMTLDSFRKAMFGKMTIVNRENAKRSINGGYADAQQLSLEGMHDVLSDADAVLGLRSWQWDQENYDAPYIIKEAFDGLNALRNQPVAQIYSDQAIDDMAIAMSAKITGGIVEAKYNSRKNPYITKLVNDLKAKRSEAVRKQKEKNRQKLAELKKKERERADKREKELAKHYQEQRAKSVEKRNLTKQKNIVARKFRSLDQKLNRADKDKTVKEGLRPTAAKLLEVGDMLFPEARSLEQMAREGVSDATAAEQKLLDRYVEYLDIREKSTTEKGKKHASAVLANIRKRLSNEGVMVEVTENGKTVKKKMSVTARERMRYDNAMREYNDLRLKTALTELEDAYRAVKDSSVGYIADSYDPNIIESIQDLRDEVGNTLAKDMTADQLKSLNDIITNTLTSINNANKLFTIERSMTDNANAVMRDIKNVRQLKDSRNELLYKSGEFLGWANFKPVYAMRFIGSDTFTDLFWKLQKGESDWYVDIAEAKEFKDKLDEKYGVGKLNTKKKTDFNYNKKATFTALDGSEFTLTLDQMMDIYAASRREQALQHLLYGGFTFAKDVKSDKFGKIQTGAKVYQLTMETIDKIVNTLTVNEKKYVEEMQEYLSTVMADKGNEVSMKLHGIKLFNEEIYWSISSTDIYAPQSEVEQEQKKDLVKKIRNAGFTKKTVKNASNPIVLQGFETKWSSHVNDMSLYHSMTLPLEDFTRVANYKERGKGATATTGVKGVLNQAYGNAASNYINQLIDDINGGIQQKMRVGFADNLVSLAKKGAVLNNLSVIIQQPSAVLRAMAYVDTRYFMIATGNKFWSFEDKQFTWNKHNKMYEELIKYAPVAGIKRMGSFDTGAGRGVIDYLASGGNESIASRVYNKGEDIASFLPEFADELAWLKLWQAIQHETKAKYGYKIGTEENKVKSGERFNEVVHLTQVYDSTLSRSQAMRGKDFGSKMLTSFMAEPTTYMNMAVDAVVQSKRTHNFKQLAKTMSALSLALIANALLVAIPHGMRDDDDDETLDEKYLQAFWEDIVSGVNPLNYFPVLKDVSSIVFENRDPSRMDLSVVSDTANTLKKAYKNIGNDNFTANDVIDIIGSAAAWGGITLKNLVRDIRSVVNTVNTFKTPKYNKEADKMGLSLPYAYQKAYDKAYDEGYSEAECKSKGETAARKEITKALKDKYLKALKESDSNTMSEIMRYMAQSGLYNKKGNTVDDTLKEWRKGSEESEKRANVAEERKAK